MKGSPLRSECMVGESIGGEALGLGRGDGDLGGLSAFESDAERHHPGHTVDFVLLFPYGLFTIRTRVEGGEEEGEAQRISRLERVEDAEPVEPPEVVEHAFGVVLAGRASNLLEQGLECGCLGAGNLLVKLGVVTGLGLDSDRVNLGHLHPLLFISGWGGGV